MNVHGGHRDYRFLDFVPPIYRAIVIETGIYPTLLLNDIADILDGREPAL